MKTKTHPQVIIPSWKYEASTKISFIFLCLFVGSFVLNLGLSSYVALQRSELASLQAKLATSEAAKQMSDAKHERALQLSDAKRNASYEALELRTEALKTSLEASKRHRTRLKELELRAIERDVQELSRDVNASRIANAIWEASRSHGIPQSLLIAVSFVESSLREDVESSAGAVGAMQIVPKYWAEFCELSPEELSSLELNYDCGAKVLAHLTREHESLRDALGAYNGALEYEVSHAKYYGKVVETMSKMRRG